MGERRHVGEVGAHARSSARRRRAQAARAAPARASRRRACARPASDGELRVEERCAVLVEGGVGLVEHEQLRVVEERAAEGEPLRHAARVRADALAAHVPQPEALEQHPDALAPLGNAVEAPEEVEVLERRELAVEDRLVADVADAPAVERDLERAARRRGEADEQPQQGRLPRAVRARDDEACRAPAPRTRAVGTPRATRSASRARPHGSGSGSPTGHVLRRARRPPRQPPPGAPPVP